MALLWSSLPGFVLGRGPALPAIGLVEDEGVFLALQRGFVGPVLFQAVEIFQEEEPGGLLGVVEFGGAAGLFPENVVDVFEGLFEHALVVPLNAVGNAADDVDDAVLSMCVQAKYHGVTRWTSTSLTDHNP